MTNRFVRLWRNHRGIDPYTIEYASPRFCVVSHLTGTAEISWDAERVSRFAKAEGVIEFRIEKVIEITNAIPFQFAFLQASPHNAPI